MIRDKIPMMMNGTLNHCPILNSMAFSDSKGAFIPGKESCPKNMPIEKRQRYAAEAIEFFGLSNYDSQDLAQLPSLADWAEAIYRRLPEGSPEALHFRSSGSTGKPVIHTLSRADFAEEIGSLLPFFRSRKRVVSVMPVHHVFGFVFALLLPKAMEIPSIVLPPLPTGDFFKALRGGDLLLAFPVFWKLIFPG